MKELQKLQQITDRLKTVYNDMTMRQLQVFLAVYYEEGQTQFHYAKKCGESETLVSRVVDRLGDKCGLLRIGRTTDNRSKAVYISETGKELVKNLTEIIREQERES